MAAAAALATSAVYPDSSFAGDKSKDLGGLKEWTTDQDVNEDGKLEFVLYPALKAAQKTVGMRPITIKHEDLVQDVKSRTDFKNAMFSEAQLEAIDKGNFVFVANKPYGKNNSYTVMVKMADETFVKLHTNYRYDFKTSKQNDVFQAVEKDLKNNPSLYRILLNTNIFSEAAVESYLFF